jgi:DNA-binding IclR family transcriptional regulator
MASHNVVQGSSGIYKLQALDRAFAVLDLLSTSATSLGLAEIAHALGLHKSTAHRFLMVLQQHRMVERTPAGKFRLGLRLCDYGFTPRTMTSREAFLKELDRTSRRGYAVDDEEREEGVRCAGVAILDGRGEAVAAVSISGPAFRVTMQKIPQIAGKLMTCVKGIQKDLGYVRLSR